MSLAAEIIRQARAKAGLSREAMREIWGVSPPLLRAIEDGAQSVGGVSAVQLARICGALGIDGEDMMAAVRNERLDNGAEIPQR